MRLLNIHIITNSRMQALLAKAKEAENARCAMLLLNLGAEVERTMEKNSGTRMKQHLNEQVKAIIHKVLTEAAKLLKESLNG